MPSTPKLPDERSIQFQQIADADGGRVADVLASSVNIEIPEASGAAAINLPRVAGDPPAVEEPVFLGTLRMACETLTPDVVERKAKLIESIAALRGIGVKRVEAGVVLISPTTGNEYLLAFDVAHGLGEHTERATK